MSPPVFRFAPTPNGYLHLGHAYAALYNQKICKAHGGTMRLRMENTDIGRCDQKYEDAIVEDLTWIGFEWQGEIRRQSEYFDDYRVVLEGLERQKLVYPSFMSRRQIRQAVEDFEKDSGKLWPRDPDGAVHYSGKERELDELSREKLRQENPNHALRLDIAAAQERYNARDGSKLASDEMNSKGKVSSVVCRLEQWGDVVLGRKEIPASYHLACVIDDAKQGISHVVRGRDILPATSVHRLLQEVLGLGAPIYHHHKLIVDENGQKYSKRYGSGSLRDLRAAGMRAEDIYDKIGIRP